MTEKILTNLPSIAEKRAFSGQQEALLLALLHAQQDCGYGQYHRFAAITDARDYANVPMMTYDNVPGFEQYWSDAKNLTGDRIAAYFLTSGSSAAPKRIPVTSTLIRQKAKAFAAFWDGVYRDHPALKTGKFIANFGDSGHSQRNADNIPEMSETTFWNQRMQGFQAKDRWPIPKQLTAIKNAELRYFAAARLALQGPLHCLMSLNPSTLVKFCDVLSTHQHALITGLSNGSWGHTALDNDDALPAPLTRRLQSNADSAQRLEALDLQNPHWQLTSLWPQLELIICWQSELVAPYLDLLRRHCDDVSFRDYITQSSECIMAIPNRDEESGGLLAHESHYYEFVPSATQHETQPEALTAEHLTVGEHYELVVTTGGGLYRYRTGDCVRVNRFESGVPHISFQYRFGRTSSITGEKLTEQQVLNAIREADSNAVLTRHDVLVFPRTGEQPHYAILADQSMLTAGCSDDALSRWALQVHNALGNANGEYKDKCASLRLGKPSILITDDLGMATLHERFRAAHVGDDQYKPGVLRRERDLDQHITIIRQANANH